MGAEYDYKLIFWCFVVPISIMVFIILCIIVNSISKSIKRKKKRNRTVKYLYSDEFNALEASVRNSINHYHSLYSHISGIVASYYGFAFKMQVEGCSSLSNHSTYNYKRPYFSPNSQSSSNVYNCSLQICKSAHNQPFKYLLKYFNVPVTEDTLIQLEEMLNDFLAVEQGLEILSQEKDSITDYVFSQIPDNIFYEDVFRKLNLSLYDSDSFRFPTYIFRYISPGGNSKMECKIEFNVSNLISFINYLSDIVEFRKSVKFQRQLMTPELREKVKSRDNYTCKHCGISINDEPHLLLEVDHIIPIAKGGITAEENLQTLCWYCNRHKGTKIS